jgi:hypothetical protein
MPQWLTDVEPSTGCNAHPPFNRLQRELATLFLGVGQLDLQLLCVSAPQRRELLLDAAATVGVGGPLDDPAGMPTSCEHAALGR